MSEVGAPFKVDIWCRDCSGQDPMGCFGGQSQFLHEKGLHGEVKTFTSLEEAKETGWNEIDDCGPWEFNIVNNESEVIYSSTFGNDG